MGHGSSLPSTCAGLAALACLALGCASSDGVPPAPGPVPAGPARVRPNLALPTLGGLQVWADVAWRQGWRVQENVVTGHFRLLDPDDVRRAWGDEAACRAELERVARELDLAPRSKHLVVLLHGLFRFRKSLDPLERELVAHGYDVCDLGYPSTRRTLEENAAVVAAVVAEQAGYDEVSFVTHSLGGLVARVLLAPDAPWPDAPRAGRLVMLGPPNQGAALARSLVATPLLGWVAGPAARVLAGDGAQDGATGGASALPVPRVPFGIVAGGRGDDEGYNPLLDGDDDGVVRVAETRLDGAADFALVRGMHTFLMRRDDVARATVAFLGTGRFPEEPAGR